MKRVKVEEVIATGGHWIYQDQSDKDQERMPFKLMFLGEGEDPACAVLGNYVFHMPVNLKDCSDMYKGEKIVLNRRMLLTGLNYLESLSRGWEVDQEEVLDWVSGMDEVIGDSELTRKLASLRVLLTGKE